MPKTSVHENDNAILTEGEVGFSEEWLVSSPPVDAISAKKRGKRKLSFLVATSANEGHDF
jgi:hypothetical protein